MTDENLNTKDGRLEKKQLKEVLLPVIRKVLEDEDTSELIRKQNANTEEITKNLLDFLLNEKGIIPKDKGGEYKELIRKEVEKWQEEQESENNPNLQEELKILEKELTGLSKEKVESFRNRLDKIEVLANEKLNTKDLKTKKEKILEMIQTMRKKVTEIEKKFQQQAGLENSDSEDIEDTDEGVPVPQEDSGKEDEGKDGKEEIIKADPVEPEPTPPPLPRKKKKKPQKTTPPPSSSPIETNSGDHVSESEEEVVPENREGNFVEVISFLIEEEESLQEQASEYKENVFARGWKRLGEMNVHNFMRQQAEKNPDGFWAKRWQEFDELPKWRKKSAEIALKAMNVRLATSVGLLGAGVGASAMEIGGLSKLAIGARSLLSGIGSGMATRGLSDIGSRAFNRWDKDVFLNEEESWNALERRYGTDELDQQINNLRRELYLEEDKKKKQKLDKQIAKLNKKLAGIYKKIEKKSSKAKTLADIENSEERIQVLSKKITDYRAYAQVNGINLRNDEVYQHLLQLRNREIRAIEPEDADKVLKYLEENLNTTEQFSHQVSKEKKKRFLRTMAGVVVGTGVASFQYLLRTGEIFGGSEKPEIEANIKPTTQPEEMVKETVDTSVKPTPEPEEIVKAPVEKAPVEAPVEPEPVSEPEPEIIESVPPVEHKGFDLENLNPTENPKLVAFAVENNLTKSELAYLQDLHDDYGLKINEDNLQKILDAGEMQRGKTTMVFDHLTRSSVSNPIKALSDSRGVVIKMLAEQGNMDGAIKFLQEECGNAANRAFKVLHVENLQDEEGLRVLLTDFADTDSDGHKDASRGIYNYLKHVAHRDTAHLQNDNGIIQVRGVKGEAPRFLDIENKKIVGGQMKGFQVSHTQELAEKISTSKQNVELSPESLLDKDEKNVLKVLRDEDVENIKGGEKIIQEIDNADKVELPKDVSDKVEKVLNKNLLDNKILEEGDVEVVKRPVPGYLKPKTYDLSEPAFDPEDPAVQSAIEVAQNMPDSVGIDVATEVGVQTTASSAVKTAEKVGQVAFAVEKTSVPSGSTGTTIDSGAGTNIAKENMAGGGGVKSENITGKAVESQSAETNLKVEEPKVIEPAQEMAPEQVTTDTVMSLEIAYKTAFENIRNQWLDDLAQIKFSGDYSSDKVKSLVTDYLNTQEQSGVGNITGTDSAGLENNIDNTLKSRLSPEMKFLILEEPSTDNSFILPTNLQDEGTNLIKFKIDGKVYFHADPDNIFKLDNQGRLLMEQEDKFVLARVGLTKDNEVAVLPEVELK